MKIVVVHRHWHPVLRVIGWCMIAPTVYFFVACWWIAVGIYKGTVWLVIFIATVIQQHRVTGDARNTTRTNGQG